MAKGHGKCTCVGMQNGISVHVTLSYVRIVITKALVKIRGEPRDKKAGSWIGRPSVVAFFVAHLFLGNWPIPAS